MTLTQDLVLTPSTMKLGERLYLHKAQAPTAYAHPLPNLAGKKLPAARGHVAFAGAPDA